MKFAQKVPCKPLKLQSVAAAGLFRLGTLQGGNDWVGVPKKEQSKPSNGFSVGVSWDTKNLGKLSEVPNSLIKPDRKLSIWKASQFAFVKSLGPQAVTGSTPMMHRVSRCFSSKVALGWAPARADVASRATADRSILQTHDIVEGY